MFFTSWCRDESHRICRPIWDTYDEIAQYKLIYGLISGLLVWAFCVLLTLQIAPISFLGVPVILWLSLRWYDHSYSIIVFLSHIYAGLRTLFPLCVPSLPCYVSSVRIRISWPRFDRLEHHSTPASSRLPLVLSVYPKIRRTSTSASAGDRKAVRWASGRVARSTSRCGGGGSETGTRPSVYTIRWTIRRTNEMSLRRIKRYEQMAIGCPPRFVTISRSRTYIFSTLPFTSREIVHQETRNVDFSQRKQVSADCTV
jgi:hypothetical protein